MVAFKFNKFQKEILICVAPSSHVCDFLSHDTGFTISDYILLEFCVLFFPPILYLFILIVYIIVRTCKYHLYGEKKLHHSCLQSRDL